MDLAHQASLSIGFSRQEYWGGLAFPPLGDLPDPEIEPMSHVIPAPGGFFILSAIRKPYLLSTCFEFFWVCTYPEVELLKSYGNSTLNFLMSYYIVFHNDCTLHSCQQFTRIPISPYPCQHSLFSAS